MHLISMRSPLRALLLMAVLVSCLHLIHRLHGSGQTAILLSSWGRAWDSAMYRHWSEKTTDTLAAWFDRHPPPYERPKNEAARLACLEAKDLEDVVFVLKTGATEIAEKLPVHIRTTLKCWPNAVVFSDFEETFQGHRVHDALANVTEEIQKTDAHFELWRRLKEQGRAGLNASELSTHFYGDNESKTGKPQVAGWGLDKFKFLPMIQKTLDVAPNAKWYIFSEVDTFVLWSNVLQWVQGMDPSRPVYLGSQAVIGGQEFGHGGSGFVVSAPAMRLVADLYRSRQRLWDEKTAEHWAGDCILAMALELQGVPLSWSFPILQGGDPLQMNFHEYGYNRKVWCYPAATYHHVNQETVEELWFMEQARRSHTSLHSPLRHGDVFKAVVMPKISGGDREDWDNGIGDPAGEWEANDAGACREKCEGFHACLQYSYASGNCRVYDKVAVGRPKMDHRSGWMLDRVRHVTREVDDCVDADWEWIMPK